ncbi:MAG TPA: type I polyketide synthase [Solirubrobacteraceae bacterium]|nr:type I polyketide synthase [Solirubrobacteraceae bacterium]
MTQTGAKSPAVQTALAEPSEAEREARLAQLICAEVGAILGPASPREPDPDRAFVDLGVNSLAGMQLAERLSDACGIELPLTLGLDHPTPRRAARHLLAMLEGRAGGAQLTQAASTPTGSAPSGGEDEPIAIVGMSCLLPGGVRSPDDLWRLVANAEDAVGPFPGDRGWELDALFHPDPGHPGTTYAREGGFVDGATDFDAAFFGISPRETRAMDPQQRLLLEATWEAFEHAGIDPGTVAGTDAGVYVGLASADYFAVIQRSDHAEIEGHIGTGTAMSVASGRIAYAFDLTGPTFTVDTACSSSLVALHLACEQLRAGRCSMAIAGGATVMTTPGPFVDYSRLRLVAPDGRCKSFGATADGAGWAEGVGVLLLEPLAEAQRRGHRVWALVRGSAINHDGATNGLTAPSGAAQERVIRDALRAARLSPGDVDAVEAHGTGTRLGDPIEARALIATYGAGRAPSDPLWLGSLKSNIAHAQAAAGVAGVIKMVMALQQDLLPPTLHAAEGTPDIDWETAPVKLLNESVRWQRAADRPRRAGVSAFGASGTNAHVILEEGPAAAGPPAPPAEPEAAAPGLYPLLLSAKSEPALRAQGGSLHAHLSARPRLRTADAGYSLVMGRARFEHRAVVLARDREQTLAALAALADGRPSPELVSGAARADAKVAFLFPGQGSQWDGMGRELWQASPVFAAQMSACEEALAPYADWSLREVLWQQPGAPALTRVDVVQPALFATMVSLAALWRSRGVHPAIVAGHSQGEIAAAHVCGALSLQDAARVVALRSRALAQLAGAGGMASLGVGRVAAEELIAEQPGRLSIAAINGPASTVVSGEPAALRKLLAACEERGLRARQVAVDYASHSDQVDGIRRQLLADLAPIEARDPQIPFLSTAAGAPPAGGATVLDGEYWYRSLREPVDFMRATRAMLDAGCTTLIEASPHPVLAPAVQETIEETVADPGRIAVLGTLRRDEGGLARLTLSLAEAYVHGVEVAWERSFDGATARQVELPSYAFQRERFWPAPEAGAGDLAAAGLDPAEHPLLAARVPSAERDACLLTGRLSPAAHEWLADHAVFETVLFPGSGFAEMALTAGSRVGADTLEELVLEAPLAIAEEAVQLQLSVGEPDEAGRREVCIYSRSTGGDGEERDWTRHARGVLAAAGSPVSDDGPVAAGEWPPAGGEPLDLAGFYERVAAQGLFYGPAFQGVRAAWKRGEEVFAEVALAPEQEQQAERFAIHPALLDAALHAGLLVAGVSEADLRLPFAWSGVRVDARGARTLRVRLSRTGKDAVRMVAFDHAGAPVASVRTLSGRPVTREQLAAARGGSRDLFHVQWTPVTADEGGRDDDRSGRWALLGEHAAELAEGLLKEGAEVEVHEQLARLVQAQADTAAASPEAVLYCPLAPGTGEGTASAETPALAREACSRTLAMLQAWLAEERLAGTRLVLLTHGAMAVGEEAPALLAAPLWGLVRSAQSEHPDRFVLMDLDRAELSSASLAAALATDEPQLALRDGVLHAPRLTRSHPGEGDLMPAFTPGDTVLITGGTGGLGGLLARHLAREHGVSRLVLTSRSGPGAAGARDLQQELAQLGCDAELVACDVTERAQVARLLEGIGVNGRLAAVVHAAGVLDDGTVASLADEQLQRVLRPKIDAAWHLHELTKESGLSAFILFSSIAGTLGGSGQANYAAGNVFLDALAQHRRAQGLAGCSLAWGLWAEATGITGSLSGGDIARMARLGVGALTSEHGLELFDEALALQEPLTVAVRLDMPALHAHARAGVLPPLLHGLVRMPPRRARDGEGSLSRSLAELPEDERHEAALAVVREHAAVVLGHTSPEAIEPRRAFKDLGFNSLTAVEFGNRLSRATGLRLPSTLVFNHPTPDAVATFLLGLVAGAPAPAAAASVAPARRAAAREEPIAIVGMSCRYPGAVRSPQELWELIAAGGDAVGEFPPDRGWELDRLYDPDPESPDTTYVKRGGFLYEATEFDAEHFSISRREAQAMDPQQRLLLEGAWEAFEDAGIDPTALAGSATGVFAGIIPSDYSIALSSAGELQGLRMTGSTTSVASGRIAYTLGLVGPAVSVDTACSSSLVAIHLACQALRRDECRMALAGGVAVMSTPAIFLEFSRQRALAPDGRCKSFAQAADGTGWSEGMGLLVLERLETAESLGHRVLAMVRGSAVNQDGASNGLTAPNGPSQERVIRQALANADLSPADVDAVEGHGTGTVLGDPIEIQALLATYGQERPPAKPLWLGSIKSNIGHPSAAGGVAGVIKMVQSLSQERLPQTLHVDSPSTHVDWSQGAVELLTEPRDWPRAARPRRAGVSAFGISGTNAHVILEEAPETPATDSPPAPPPVLPALVSAKSPAALRAQAHRLGEHLQRHPELAAHDVCHSLATARAHLRHRAVVLGEDREELVAGLELLARGERSAGVLEGEAAGEDSAVALMFTGQGSQRAGMGSELYRVFPGFAGALDSVCEEFGERLGEPLLEVMFAEPGSSRATLLDQTAFTQAALFALEVALFRLVESFGMKPRFLVGHSIGELAAAHVAGVLTLPDACTLVAARGTLMQELPQGGAMVAFQASEDEALELTAGAEDRVSLAAVNGPEAVVISGDEADVLSLARQWERRGRETKRLTVSHAFHSPLMEPMLDEFAARIGDLAFSPPELPIVATAAGRPLGEELATPGYWVRQVREPVRFHEAVRWLAQAGAACFLELGPASTLTALARASMADRDGSPQEPPLLAATMARRRPEARTLLGALAKAHARGVALDWHELAPGERVPLPTYAFRRERCWATGAGAPSRVAEPDAFGLIGSDHPILTATVPPVEGEEWVFSGRLSIASQPWLRDHAIGGATLVSGTTLLEMALAAGRRLGWELVEELVLERPLTLVPDAALALQLRVGEPDESGRRGFGVFAHAADDLGGEGPIGAGGWARHASGALARRAPTGAPDAASPPAPPASAWPPQDAAPIDLDGLYERLAARGFDFGPSFRGLRHAWRAPDAVYAELADDDALAPGFLVSPGTLDAAFHALIEDDAEPRLPFAWSGVRLGPGDRRTWRVRLAPTADGVGMRAEDEHGRTIASAVSVVSRPLDRAALERVSRPALYGIAWEQVALEPADPSPCVVVGEEDENQELPGERHRDLRALAEAIDAGAAEPACVVLTGAGAREGQTGTGVAEPVLAVVQECTEALQLALADERLARSRLVVLTRGAAAVRGEEPPDPAAAAIHGLVRSVQAEHPGRVCLLDGDRHPESQRTLLAALGQDHPELAVREGVAYAPRIQRLADRSDPPFELDREGTTLITGGTGGLGAEMARHLVAAHGVRNLLLLSRRGEAAEGANELRIELAERGAEATVLACDVGDREALSAAIATIPADRPLRAVIHAAAALDDGVFLSLTPERLASVLRPKAEGALHLHELTRELELSAFVLCSSLAGTVGAPGQANYSAANAFLDALALHRRASGLPASSHAWGWWAQAGGLTAHLGSTDVARLHRSGIAPLSREEGLALFDLALAEDPPFAIAARVNRAALLGRPGDGASALARLLGAAGRRAAPGAGRGSLRESLAGLTAGEQRAAVLRALCRELADVLGLPDPERLDARRTFKDLGTESLHATELRNRLETVTGLRLPVTVVFDYSSPAELAGYLHAQLTQGEANGSSPSAMLAALQLGADSAGLSDEQRTQLQQQLRALLVKLEAPRGRAGEEVSAERIQQASEDALYDLIDNGLGVPTV